MYVTSPSERALVAHKAQEEANAYWGRQEAYDYAKSFPERHQQQVAFTALHLLPRMKPTDHVVDIGCANGWNALLLAPHCGSLHGYDYNEKFVEAAARSATEQGFDHLTFTVANVLELELAEASADVIIISGLLTCLVEDSSARQVLQLASRCLKPGGLAILKDTLYRRDGVSINFQEDYYGAVYRDMATYRALAAEAGFQFSASEWFNDGEDYSTLIAFSIKAGS
jgi:ubiquinone/menaquinone biosynthesis C-methylase UbiE